MGRDAVHWRPDRFKRVLVPLDGSAHSETALDTAREFSDKLDAEIVLMRVVEPLFYRVAYYPPIEPSRALAAAKDYLNRIAGRLRSGGLRVMMRVEYGQAIATITQVARELTGRSDRDGRPSKETRRGMARKASACIRRAAESGWGFLELPGDALDANDSLTAEGIATTVAMLIAHRPQVACERDGQLPLADERQRIGVAVSTDLQRAVVEQALADLNVTGVSVRTYNRHQVLEYAITVLWHPLSSIPDLNPFHGDIGRLCVGISRHRHAAIVVGRRGLRRLLEDPPLSPEAPWPGLRDRFLAGWLAHAEFLSYLDAIGATEPAEIHRS